MYLTQECLDERLFKDLSVDFDKDWDNSCNFFNSEEEALQCVAERMGIDLEVLVHILRKKEMIKELKINLQKTEEERVHSLALIYSKMIPKINGENYESAAKRLSDEVKQKIESKVFHKSVMLIISK